jgi:uncharacterized protein YqeY
MGKKADLKEAMKNAMRAKDAARLEVIRGVLSTIQYEEMAKGVDDIGDDGVIAMVQREIKKREEEREYATQAGRSELIEKADSELAVLKAFLPTQLDRSALTTIITDLRSVNPTMNMGALMSALKKDYAGQYDGKLASDIAKELLTGAKA